MMFQPWASVAISRTLMPNSTTTGLPYHGSAASTTTTTARPSARARLTRPPWRCAPSPRGGTSALGAAGRRPRCPPEPPGRAPDQHQHQDAEARDITVGRADVQRGQRLDHAQREAADDHPERVVQAADDRDHERLGGERSEE